MLTNCFSRPSTWLNMRRKNFSQYKQYRVMTILGFRKVMPFPITDAACKYLYLGTISIVFFYAKMQNLLLLYTFNSGICY